MKKTQADVVVLGGGPAGIAAALSAARRGADTLIIEKNAYVGGCAASGLPFIDFFSRIGVQTVRGVAEELMERLKAENACLGHIPTTNGHINSITMIDPEWVKITAEEMLLEAGCHFLYDSFVAAAGVKEGRLSSVTVANKGGLTEISAKCFIDCTGDGDVAAFAGAEYEKGRPGDQLMQAMSLLFRLINVDVREFGKYFDKNPIVTTPFGADEPYNVHISGTLAPWDDIILKEKVFDHPAHNFWAGTCRDNELTYVNTVRVAMKDATDPEELTAAEIEGRRQMKNVVRFLNAHVPGMEKAYIGAVQNGIGIRETRRILGEYVLTGEDVLQGRKFDDAIAKTNYCIDIHDPKGEKWTTSFIKSEDACYEIPYRCLVPRTLDGLLVAGRCISTTHEALGSTRIMAPCMATGQAAGTAAAMAAGQGIPARNVDIQDLRAALKKDGAVL